MLYVVTGPPAAGKTTWVQDHAQPGDIIIDYDHLAQALTQHGDHHAHPDHIRTVTLAARRAAIEAALPLIDQHDVYLIHSIPSPSQRARYQAHDARIITIDPGEDIVRERIRTNRPHHHQRIADQWYQPTEPRPRPTKARRPPSIARPKTTSQRGYGGPHQKKRKQYEPLVRSGNATCWRCGEPIDPNGPWDLGHDDLDRTKYRGPEHVDCNRGAPRRSKNNDADHTRKW